MSVLNIYLADDHPVVRKGLLGLIDAQPDMKVVGEAPDGETAVEEAGRLRPDVVVMDVSMPGIGGIEATARIRRSLPGVRVVALTAHADRGYLEQMLSAGATGFVLKRSAAEGLVAAIRRAAVGESYIDPAVAGQVAADPAGVDSGVAAGGELSDIEAEVLRLTATGQMKKEIAAQLGISDTMVDAYKALAAGKLGLTSRAEIVRYASRRGWLGDGC